MSGELVPQPRHVDQSRERHRVQFRAVHLPRAAASLDALKDGLGGVVREEVSERRIHRKTRRTRRSPERPVRKRLRWHLAKPMVEHGKAARETGQHRHLLGGESGHDLGVFLIGGLATHFRGEGADVIGDETVHGRRLFGFGGVVRRHNVGTEFESVGLVKDVVQLHVRMRIFLASVRIGAVHIGGDGEGDAPPLRSVLGPWGNRVGKFLAEHAVELDVVLGAVEAAQQVVERTVFENHQNDVIHGIGRGEVARIRSGSVIGIRHGRVVGCPVGIFF